MVFDERNRNQSGSEQTKQGSHDGRRSEQTKQGQGSHDGKRSEQTKQGQSSHGNNSRKNS